MSLRSLLCRLLGCCSAGDFLPPRALVTLAVDGVSVTVHLPSKGTIMFKIPTDRVAAGAVSYVDKAGNPAIVDGTPVWKSSDDSVLSVAASEDGLSATVTPTGKLGQAQVSIEADADLGEGVKPIVTLVDVEVVGGEAVAGNVSLSLVP